jgi:hypothetical protein
MLSLMLCRGAGASQASDRDAAHRHAIRAAELVRQLKLDDALAELNLAYQLFPEPALLFALGQVHRKRGDVEQARHFFELYLANHPGGRAARIAREYLSRPTPPPRASALSGASNSNPAAPELPPMVSPNPAPPEPPPAGTNPAAPTQAATAEPPAATVLVRSLPEAMKPTAEATATDARRAPRGLVGAGVSPWPHRTALGVALGAAAIATTTGIWAIVHQDGVDRLCNSDHSCNAAGIAEARTGHTLVDATDVAWGVAAAAATTSTLLYLRYRSSLVVSPSLHARGGGLVVGTLSW